MAKAVHVERREQGCGLAEWPSHKPGFPIQLLCGVTGQRRSNIKGTQLDGQPCRHTRKLCVALDMVWAETWQWDGAGAEVEVAVVKHSVGGWGAGRSSEELRPAGRLGPELPASCGPA